MAKHHLAVVDSLSKIIRNQQQIIENMENKSYRESCMLARLNQERNETARELKAKGQLSLSSWIRGSSSSKRRATSSRPTWALLQMKNSSLKSGRKARSSAPRFDVYAPHKAPGPPEPFLHLPQGAVIAGNSWKVGPACYTSLWQ